MVWGWGCAGWGVVFGIDKLWCMDVGLEKPFEKPTLGVGFWGKNWLGCVAVGGRVSVYRVWRGLVGFDIAVEAGGAVEMEDVIDVFLHGAEVGVEGVGVLVGAVAGALGEGVHGWGWV